MYTFWHVGLEGLTVEDYMKKLLIVVAFAGICDVYCSEGKQESHSDGAVENQDIAVVREKVIEEQCNLLKKMAIVAQVRINRALEDMKAQGVTKELFDKTEESFVHFANGVFAMHKVCPPIKATEEKVQNHAELN